MAYQVLARKYRPKQFEDVIGQEHVTRALVNSLKFSTLAHAYLFTGTRGVGKTSIARLFSKAIRCEQPTANLNPCLKCESCLDIDSNQSLNFSEIDGASNNSVDDIRSLIENVKYLPTKGKYKIYVIDEVHMLSTSAFNALLKTLEEPPAHVILILATTDPQKLLSTVISRCQRFDYKSVAVSELIKQILKISSLEKINFSSPKIMEKLAIQGQGSVRDTLSLLDQLRGLAGDKIITDELFSQAMGLANTELVYNLVRCLLVGDITSLNKYYFEVLDLNIDVKRFAKQLEEILYGLVQSFDRNFDFEYPIEVNDVSISESIWIYENFAKDLSWVLSSLSPDHTFLVLLQKLALRRTILKDENPVYLDFSKNNSQQPKLEMKSKPVAKAKDWNGFMSEINQTQPTLAINLAHGDLIEAPDLNTQNRVFKIGFKTEALVFRDFLIQKETTEKLINSLAKYYEVQEPMISVLFEEIKNSKNNFMSQIEKEDLKTKENKEAKKTKILNQPLIKEAEKIFNSKIDKVILKEN